jgi:hypothetical protein
MRQSKLFRILLFISLIGGVSLVQMPLFMRTVSAHSGGTDSSGCHTCHTNCPSYGLNFGQYHCHNPKRDYSGGGNGFSTLPPLQPLPTYQFQTPTTLPPYRYSTPTTSSGYRFVPQIAPSPTWRPASNTSSSQNEDDFLGAIGFIALVAIIIWFFSRP